MLGVFIVLRGYREGDEEHGMGSGVASPVTTNHAAKGSVFVNLRNPGNLEMSPLI